MKRYTFNLGTVLRARQLQEDTARAALQRAHMAALAAELAANSSRAHYEELKAPSDEEFMAHRQRSELAAQAVLGAQDRLAGAREAVTASMSEYVVAAKAVSVLEHLDERRRQEHALATQRQEVAEVDELVTNRHGRRRQDAKKERRQG
jgi:flagellar biosynthesis chaperone FliJ